MRYFVTLFCLMWVCAGAVMPSYAQQSECEINLVEVTRMLTEAENAQRIGDTERALSLLGQARVQIEAI